MCFKQLPEDLFRFKFLCPKVCEFVDIGIDTGLTLSDFFIFLVDS